MPATHQSFKLICIPDIDRLHIFPILFWYAEGKKFPILSDILVVNFSNFKNSRYIISKVVLKSAF